jgi:hypothetical protein
MEKPVRIALEQAVNGELDRRKKPRETRAARASR